MKMKERNRQLKSALGAMATKERLHDAASIPAEDTVNRQGCKAYSLSDELRLISMLNTLKLEPQAYRSESSTMKELRDIIERIGMNDPYFLAQSIVYSRCLGEGMRSINHLAAALAAPFVAGQPYAKAFYGLFDKKAKIGGCVYRPDDMKEIKDVFSALNSSVLSNAMKKGFASALEKMDTYSLAKYKDTVIDIANLVHPKSNVSRATIKTEDGVIKALDAIMKGITVSADTWEVANSEAGQEVAKAVKAGKLTQEDAKQVLADAKNDNWEALLNEGKLGVLAALRNIRNMMKSPSASVIEKLCALLRDGEKIRAGKIMPYQIDTAYEVIHEEMINNQYAHKVLQALLDGYESSIPNLAAALPGKTCVMIDCSGSMHAACFNGHGKMRNATACEKAGLIAATIAKATKATVVRFGDYAEIANYSAADNVFSLGKYLSQNDMGCTSIAAAWELIRERGMKFDRVIILSDNECNCSSWRGNWTSGAYKQYVHDVASPYVYCIDFAAYGTTPLKNEGKVNYYFGFGYAMFDDISSKEFNPNIHLEKVRKVVIDPNYKPAK